MNHNFKVGDRAVAELLLWGSVPFAKKDIYGTITSILGETEGHEHKSKLKYEFTHQFGTFYTDNLEGELRLDDSEDTLLRCPFCGGEAEIIQTGNDYTKTRSAEIKCTICKTTQITVSISQSLEWCVKTATKKWNKRIKNDNV